MSRKSFKRNLSVTEVIAVAAFLISCGTLYLTYRQFQFVDAPVSVETPQEMPNIQVEPDFSNKSLNVRITDHLRIINNSTNPAYMTDMRCEGGFRLSADHRAFAYMQNSCHIFDNSADSEAAKSQINALSFSGNQFREITIVATIPLFGTGAQDPYREYLGYIRNGKIFDTKAFLLYFGRKGYLSLGSKENPRREVIVTRGSGICNSYAIVFYGKTRYGSVTNNNDYSIDGPELTDNCVHNGGPPTINGRAPINRTTPDDLPAFPK